MTWLGVEPVHPRPGSSGGPEEMVLGRVRNGEPAVPPSALGALSGDPLGHPPARAISP